MAQIERALELDPQNSLIWGFYTVDLMYARRWDDAMAAARHTAALSPDQRVGAGQMWNILFAKRMYKESVDAKISFESKFGSRAIAEALKRGYAQGGYQAAFLAAAEEGVSLWQQRRAFRAFEVAAFYERTGRIDEALGWYEKAVDEHDPNCPYIRLSIRGPVPKDNPRFQAILRRIGVP